VVQSGTPLSWSETEASVSAPPLEVGDYDVHVVVGGEESNTIEFRRVASEATDAPVINYIDPENGPVSQYVTLFGSNFGTQTGTVRFSSESLGYEALGDTDFPDECDDDFWSQTSVTVKVPEEFINGDDVVLDDYDVWLVRADTEESNIVDFVIDESELTPGICAISPASGPVGVDVSVYGERLGSDLGEVNFWESISASIALWEDEQIDCSVPDGAGTGPVVAIADGVESNTINFMVANCIDDNDACEDDELCCDNGACYAIVDGCPEIATPSSSLAWIFSTGEIPTFPEVVESCTESVKSPSPWSARAGGDEACVESIISASFSKEMDQSTLNSDNIKVYGCDEEDCINLTEIIPTSITYPDAPTFYWTPDGDLVADTWHLVTLSSDIADIDGYNLEAEYSWQFKTRDDVTPCEVGEIFVNPGTYASTE